MAPTGGELDTKLDRSEFWQRVAAVSFGLWSLMIPLGVWILSTTFDRALRQSAEQSADAAMFRKNFENYVLNMEKRMTIVEERQNGVLRALNDFDSRIDRLDGKHDLGNGHKER